MSQRWDMGSRRGETETEMPDLRNEHGWQMSGYELKRRLGIDPYGPMPPGLETSWTDVDGELVRVLPRNRGADGKSQFGHRVVVLCRCGRIVPAGRLHQHRGRISIGRGRKASGLLCVRAS